MKQVMVLVEGQTEERFVKQVLRPHFEAIGAFFQPVILETSRRQSGHVFRGGVTSFGQFERHARRLIYQAGVDLVSTMVDYYGLPSDFPGMSNRPHGTPHVRVAHVEQSIHEYFGAPLHFMPYLSLHEFEALLFSDVRELANALTGASTAQLRELAAIPTKFSSPEEINERPDQSPSKRIVRAVPGYRKTLHGPLICDRIGLANLRTSCGHFDAWVAALEAQVTGRSV